MTVRHKKTALPTSGSRVHANDWNDGHVDSAGFPVTSGSWRGPFNVTYSQLPSNGDFLHLLDLVAGTMVLDAFVVTNIAFDSGVAMGLAILETGNLASSFQFGAGTFDLDQVDGTPGFFVVGRALAATRPFRIVGDCELSAYLDVGVIGATGDVDVYVLMAELT